MSFPLIRGYAFRATKLDGCGNPVFGPDSVVTTEGIITVGLTANNDAGTAISVTNAAGKVCISDTPAPKFLNYTMEIALCGVDPELVGLLTGNPVVLDADDNPIGFDVDSDVDLAGSGFAFEMWSGVPTASCEGGEVSYGYFLSPFAQGGTLGDFTVQNSEINFTISGAVTKDGSPWGSGPYNVQDDGTGVAGPLVTPVSDKNHLRMIKVTVPPPTLADGATALGVPATSAVAGAPGHTNPANSYAPLNLAGLSGVTASPTTAWTTGQYIRLRDGSTAHWNGTAWVAGVA